MCALDDAQQTETSGGLRESKERMAETKKETQREAEAERLSRTYVRVCVCACV